jgi:translocation and assembly module TamB
MRKKILITLSAVAGIVFLAAALLPWWLGAALALAGGKAGLAFDSYQRIGYSRFALTGVEFDTGSVTVTADRVELGGALGWLLGRPGEINAGKWSVVVARKAADKPPANGPSGWVPLRSVLMKVIDGLEQRLPVTHLGEGSVKWPGGGLALDSAVWDTRQLAVTNLRMNGLEADVTVRRDKKDLVATLESFGGQWDATVRSAGSELAATGTWREQAWRLDADFAETGWLPLEATAKAPAWTVPAAYAQMGEYYGEIRGRAEATWREGALAVSLNAASQPLKDSDAPPLSVELHGSGGVDRLSLDRIDLQLPGVDGHLSEPVVIGRDGRLVSGASKFVFSADLEKQPWVKGTGVVSGEVEVAPQASGNPLIEATVTTRDAVIADWKIRSLGVDAEIVWPDVRVQSVHLQLADGDELTATGNWNARTRTLTGGRVQGRVSGGTLARWLPAKTEFNRFELTATGEGPWPAIKHTGKLKADAFRIDPLRPVGLESTWAGTGRTIDAFSLQATAADSRLRMTGAVGAEEARIDELVLTQGDTERLRLAAPTQVRWVPALVLPNIVLKGTDAELAAGVTWADSGAVNVHAAHVHSAWFTDFVDIPGPDWVIGNLDADGRWDNGPLTFKAAGQGVMNLADGKRVDLTLSAHGEPGRVQLDAVNVTLAQQPVVRITGAIPVTVYPRARERLVFNETDPLSLQAATEPNVAFWEQVGGLLGVVITEPSVNVSLAGTLEKPVGEATVHVTKLAARDDQKARLWPSIENLDARLTGDRSGVALETFALKADGQTVRASGRLPVKDWANVMKNPLDLVGAEGEARIEIPDADVAALARYAPAYLAPTGKLTVDVTLEKGGQLSGAIRLKDAASRPLGPLGVLQSIGAEIVFKGRTAELRQVTATSGGQKVTLSGSVALPKDGVPRLDLSLKGEKLPFIRQTGLLMRGDVDLKVTTGDDDITRITGATRLRESLFLVDLRALLPKGGARNAPGRRPPYFAVTVPPFNSWPVDVTVDGDRFLRLRTPVFTGLASAHFRLRGTLGDPRAQGEATVNQGQVMLPFATFTVRQGGVRITEANPFEPALSLIGVGRSFGYDLRMELTGTVDKPKLTFFSTPSLESEQILLMVMAGETPQNEITYTAGERVARLGTYLGQSLLWQFGADPESTDKLSVKVGERVSRHGRETYGIEYELDPRWSLIGEYDEFDEYNLGVKWKVYTSKPDTKEAADAKK